MGAISNLTYLRATGAAFWYNVAVQGFACMFYTDELRGVLYVAAWPECT
jgi:hypothetical protein